MKDVDFREDREEFYRELYKHDVKKLVDELEDVDAIKVLLDYAFGYLELQKAKAKAKEIENATKKSRARATA